MCRFESRSTRSSLKIQARQIPVLLSCLPLAASGKHAQPHLHLDYRFAGQAAGHVLGQRHMNAPQLQAAGHRAACGSLVWQALDEDGHIACKQISSSMK